MIRTREDLDAVAGTPEHAAFMALLHGSIYRPEYNAESGAWVAVEDDSLIGQFGFALADFPDRQAPDLSGLPPVGAITAADVNRERDRRLAGDFLFNGVLFQRDAVSLQRITGAATQAGFAMLNGSQPGDMRWFNPAADFVWISSNNTLVPMDAQTCYAFGQAASAVETALIFKAKALREMNPIPADYTNDSYWT